MLSIITLQERHRSYEGIVKESTLAHFHCVNYSGLFPHIPNDLLTCLRHGGQSQTLLVDSLTAMIEQRCCKWGTHSISIHTISQTWIQHLIHLTNIAIIYISQTYQIVGSWDFKVARLAVALPYAALCFTSIFTHKVPTLAIRCKLPVCIPRTNAQSKQTWLLWFL